MREGGTFGTVTVPYMIESSAVDDLSPSNGLLIFNEGITQMVRFNSLKCNFIFPPSLSPSPSFSFFSPSLPLSLSSLEYNVNCSC